ncbi:hypothetical protein PR202_gb05025 [Eleusine coracana subsp. coracana]|uniref:Vesicle transport v-SNARE N-terminal domain-containing protein n=1 Tax=Eleusine coracana subsp. coracana TaxID=191504 RepID=A0AAV5E5N6_ELECO|nr:hypothetical protein PR202_gb05025 [Eleusine coracana subsp. coracana]
MSLETISANVVIPFLPSGPDQSRSRLPKNPPRPAAWIEFPSNLLLPSRSIRGRGIAAAVGSCRYRRSELAAGFGDTGAGDRSEQQQAAAMSEVFEGYERQYCEASASLSRKCTAASALDGEKKRQKLSEIQAGVEEAESLIRKMDLEARSLQPSVKAGLLAKLREYNLTSPTSRASSRGSLHRTPSRLPGRNFLRLAWLTRLRTFTNNDSHCYMLIPLYLHGVDDNIGKSKKILAAMSKRMDRNKWIIGGIIATLVLAILLILYFKITH